MEQWVPIAGMEDYAISSLGNYKRIKPFERIRKSSPNSDGYPRAMITINGKQKHLSIHRLVAKAFIANPENKLEVNHIDFDRTNNDVDNLEWCTRSENIAHTVAHNRQTSSLGVKNPRAILNEVQVINIRHMKGSAKTTEIAKLYGVSKETIKDIFKRRSWRHI